MSASASTISFYVTGGTLRHDTPSYVERQADTALYEGIKRGEFCYVLTSRQMGKSSLMNRTAARLREEGIATATLDPTGVGQNLTAEQWYGGLLIQLGYKLDLEDELEEFWIDQERMGPLQRWMAAIRQVVLARVPGRVVLFIDEIDTVLSLPFSTDEFFAAIRECYNRRTEDPELERLTFCLLGVAAPSDLIRDTRLTPFNIGRRIELTDFTRAEAAPLRSGLVLGSAEMSGRDEAEAQRLLDRLLYWTGGHPYLTQRLCRAVAEDPTVRGPAGVDRHCAALFLSSSAQEQDDNLIFVRERLLRSEADLASLLDLYGKVRAGRRVPVDDTNQMVTLLRLSGITRVREAGRPTPDTRHPTPSLIVRNRIYERVFDREWVSQHMPDAEVRRQKAAYRRGLLRATAVSGVVLAVMGALALAAVQSESRARQAAEGRRVALVAAQKERDNAVQAGERERDQRQAAQEAEKRASRSALAERQSATAAKEAARRADGEKERAEENAGIARQQERVARAAEEKQRVERVRGARLLYDANMQLASQAWEAGASQRVTELLAAHAPHSWGTDLSHGSVRWEGENPGFEWRYQWRLMHAGSVTFRGHAGAVMHGAIAPDGHLITLDANLQLRRWDPTTGKAIRTVNLASECNLYRMALSHDGRTLAVRTPTGAIRLLDTATGRLRRVLRGHDPGAVAPAPNENARYFKVSLAFSPDDSRLVSLGVFDRTVRVWDVASGRQVALLRRLPDAETLALSNDLALAPDGHTLVVANHPDPGNFTTGYYDLAKGVAQESLLGVLGGGAGSVRSVAYSPDGSIVATGDWSGIVLSDPKTQKRIRRLGTEEDSVIKLAFSPDGKTLATGNLDARVKLWEVASGRELRTLKGHTAPITFLAFSADGRRLATGGRDGMARLWDLATSGGARVLTQHTNDVQSLAFSSDGRLLATGSWDRTAKIWEVKTGRLLRSLPPQKWAVLSVAFSPDGRTLATGLHYSEVKLWDVATGREYYRMPGELPSTYRPFFGLQVAALAYSPDGRFLAAGHGFPNSTAPDNQALLRIWDMRSRRLIRAFSPHQNHIRAVLFSADGKLLVTGSKDRTVKLWRVGSWQLIRTLTGFDDPIYAAALSPNGRTLAVGTIAGTIQLCDAVTGQKGKILRGHIGTIQALAFSPEGTRLASTGQDRSVKLWDVVSGRETRTLTGHTEGVGPVQFSPDGNILATGSADNTVRLWDAATPQEIVAAERGVTPVGRRAPEVVALEWRRQAEERLQKREWSDALPYLERLLRRDPSQWRDRLNRARALARLNRPVEAEAEFARAAARAPGDPELWMERGGVYAWLGRWKEAAEDFTRVIDREAGDARIWYERALAAMAGSDRDTYRRVRSRLVTRVIARQPDDAEAWLELGRAHGDLFQWRQAAGDFTRALSLKASGPEPWIERGRAYAMLGDWKAAAADFARALDANVNDTAGVWRDHASALLGSGDVAAYRRACEGLLARFAGTDNGARARNVAQLCLLTPDPVGDLQQTLRMAEKAVAEQDPTFGPNYPLRMTLGLAYYRAGRLDAALQRVTESIAASPYGENGVNWLLLAMIHHRLGHAVEARRWLAKGRSWRPDPEQWSWQIRLEHQVLLREAEALLGQKTSSKP